MNSQNNYFTEKLHSLKTNINRTVPAVADSNTRFAVHKCEAQIEHNALNA